MQGVHQLWFYITGQGSSVMVLHHWTGLISYVSAALHRVISYGSASLHRVHQLWFCITVQGSSVMVLQHSTGLSVTVLHHSTGSISYGSASLGRVHQLRFCITAQGYQSGESICQNHLLTLLATRDLDSRSCYLKCSHLCSIFAVTVSSRDCINFVNLSSQ